MSRLFPPAFRRLLAEVVRRTPRGGQREAGQARLRRRSESGTFSGHEAYVAGHDLRYLDWNVYARTGDLFVKVLEAEERRTRTLLVDTSPSMGVGEPSRADAARRLTALLGAQALARLDGLALHSGASERGEHFEGVAALPALLARLEELPEVDVDPLVLARSVPRHGGPVVWIGDFNEPERWRPGLRLLRHRHRRATGVVPGLAEDRIPAVGGIVRLRDPESGDEETLVVDAALRGAVADELTRLARSQDRVFASTGHRLFRWPAPAAGDYRLRSWTGGLVSP